MQGPSGDVVQGVPLRRPQDDIGEGGNGASPDGRNGTSQEVHVLGQQNVRSLPQLVPNVNTATRVTVSRDAFESYLRNREITTWEEFVVRAQSFNSMDVSNAASRPNDDTSTGVKIMTWLAIWLINSAVWGIVGLLTTLFWVFGLLGMMLYTYLLVKFLKKIENESQGERENLYYKIVVDRLWVLVPICVTVMLAYLMKNVVEPLLPENRFWGCMRLLVLLFMAVPHLFTSIKIWKKHRPAALMLNLYFGVLAICMMVVDLTGDWLHVPMNNWDEEDWERMQHPERFDREHTSSGEAPRFDEDGNPLPPELDENGNPVKIDKETGKILKSTETRPPLIKPKHLLPNKKFGGGMEEAMTEAAYANKEGELLNEDREKIGTAPDEKKGEAGGLRRAVGTFEQSEPGSAEPSAEEQTETNANLNPAAPPAESAAEPAEGKETEENPPQAKDDEEKPARPRKPHVPMPPDMGFHENEIMHPDHEGDDDDNNGETRWEDRSKLRPKPAKWWLDYGITKDYLFRCVFFYQSVFVVLLLLIKAKREHFDLDNLPEHITWLAHISGFMFFIGSFVILRLPTWDEDNSDLPKWLVYTGLLHVTIAMGLLFAKWRLLLLGGIGWAFLFWRTSTLFSWVLMKIGLPDILQTLGAFLCIAAFGTLCIWITLKIGGNDSTGALGMRVKLRRMLRIQPNLNDPNLRQRLVDAEMLGEGNTQSGIRSSEALA